MEEIWKQIEDTTYEISSLGRVKNKYDYILSQSLTERGYLKISLFFDSKLNTRTVHRLVAKAFVDGYVEGLTVNHKDCNKLNNNYNNLEWMSLIDNYKHGITNNCSCKGEDRPESILKESDVLDIIELIKDGCTDIEIAKIYNIVHSSIYKIRVGISWKHIKRPVFDKVGIIKKLTVTDIPIIRQMLLDGISLANIAKKFKVHSGTISGIKQGRSWKNY